MHTAAFDPRLSNTAAWGSAVSVTAAGVVPAHAALAAVSPAQGASSVFWVGSNGAILEAYYDARLGTGAHWTGPVAVSGTGEASPGTALAAISSVAGGVTLFWVRSNGSIGSTFYDPRVANPAWAIPAFSLRGPGTANGSSIAALSTNPGQSSVFWVASDGSVRSTYYDPAFPANGWVQPFAISESQAARGGADLVAFSTKPGGSSIFWIDGAGAVRTAYYDPALPSRGWGTGIAPAVTARNEANGGRLIGMSTVTGGASLFWTGPAGAVHSTYFDPRTPSLGWVPPFALGSVEAVKQGTPVAAVSSAPGNTDVFFINERGALRSTYYTPTTGWK